MENTVKLQGISGHQKGTKIKDLKIGDIIVWNLGYKSEVIGIEPSKTGKTIAFIQYLPVLIRFGKKRKTSLFFFYRIPQPLKRGGHAGNSNDSKVKRAIALFFYVQHPQPLSRGFSLCRLPIRIVPLLFGSAFVLYGFQGVCSCVAYLITRKCLKGR